MKTCIILHLLKVKRQPDINYFNLAGGYMYTFYSKFLHINWGWNGECNGYFNGEVFNPSNAYITERDYTPTHTNEYKYDLQTLKVKAYETLQSEN